ncbi:HNH endonuclease [Corynebacterium phoceense]|uniref:HNH endonuclease signature motif containing protein n=1 Tax=Corynebacterium phoceense TaxID=1686286 RepID=UPI00211C76E3|nr:HNH endonuclease signature motif containing protein [Corynebacterium phoceense]MCQ9334185.1 HNH endonuclease [Corynebacterium phoceense]
MNSFVSRLKEENVDSLRELKGWRRTDYWDAGLSTADADFYMPLVRTFWEAGHPRIGEARAAARRLGHGIRVLAKIDRLAKKGDNPNDLRVLLCGTREQDLDKVAAQHTTPPETKDEATVGVSQDGRNRLVIRSTEPWLMDYIHGLPGVEPGKYEGLYEGLKKHVENRTQLTAPRRMIHILVNLHDLEMILRGDGEDILVRATDGTWRTGAELMEELLAGVGLATIVNARNEPMKQYRLKRYFTQAQRDMAAAVQHTCMDPDCKIPFSLCQADHLKAWAKGGETNLGNILMLCEYHNMKKRDGDVYYKGADGRIYKRREFGPDVPCN